MIEKNFIGHTLSAKGERVTRGSNPITSEVLPGDFINATDEDNIIFPPENGQVGLSTSMGYLSTVDDARKYLEGIYNNNIKES